LKDTVSHWEIKYMTTHKELNGIKDDIEIWKAKAEKHKRKYKKVTIEITNNTTHTVHFEKQIFTLEAECKRLKLALITMQETNDHNQKEIEDLIRKLKIAEVKAKTSSYTVSSSYTPREKSDYKYTSSYTPQSSSKYSSSNATKTVTVTTSKTVRKGSGSRSGSSSSSKSSSSSSDNKKHKFH
jgi:regulator of replication initiation timing